jgi:hypothetical protein
MLDIYAIVEVGRLLYDVGKWIQESISDAENNRELNTGTKKHHYVAQNVNNRIDNYIPRKQKDGSDNPVSAFGLASARDEAKKQVNHLIRTAVDVKHGIGEFVKGGE